MKFIRYGKYVGEAADAVDLEELVKRLGDFFLQSGFESQYYGVNEMDPDRSMEALREAILRALQEGDILPDDAMSDELREMLQDPGAMNNQEVKDLIEKLMERLGQEGFINPRQPPQVTPPNTTSARGQVGDAQERQQEVRFEITDKTIDFLGFKTLQDLLGSLGRSSFGRHDTRDLATGVESGGVSRPYEFGDTLNMDISATLFNAVRREGAKVPIEMNYSDLMVHQCEYHSSCATVVLLDCSHSMILYGEDRFTPAKRVAMALVSFDSNAISRRHAESGAIPRQRRGSSYWRTSTRTGRSVLHQYARRSAHGATHLVAPEKRYAADCDDHRRQALRAHARRWTDLQERVWLRPVRSRSNFGRSEQVQARRNHDQYFHACQRLQPGPFCAKNYRDV